jgi:hypothetical protein
MTPEAARAAAWSEASKLAKDPAHQEKLMRGDPEARARQIEINKRVIGSDIVAGKDVDPAKLGPGAAEAVAARTKLEMDQYFNEVRTHAFVPEMLEQHIRDNKPITSAQRRWVEEQASQLRRDQDWVERWTRGDQLALSQWNAIGMWRGLRVEG